MFAKTICLIAFAAVAMAAPQFNRDPNNNGDRTAQMRRVEDLRNKGLTCNEAAQETFVCSDGLGGDWSVYIHAFSTILLRPLTNFISNSSVNIFGEGNCLI